MAAQQAYCRLEAHMPAKGPEGLPDEYFMLWVLLAQCRDSILRARERDYSRFGISNERRAILFIIENSKAQADLHIARIWYAANSCLGSWHVKLSKETKKQKAKGDIRTHFEPNTKDPTTDSINKAPSQGSEPAAANSTPSWRFRFLANGPDIGIRCIPG